MKLFKVILIVLLSLLALSVVTIAGVAIITLSTGGGGFRGAEWLVGLGFGALWAALGSAVLIVLAVIAAWFQRRTGNGLTRRR